MVVVDMVRIQLRTQAEDPVALVGSVTRSEFKLRAPRSLSTRVLTKAYQFTTTLRTCRLGLAECRQALVNTTYGCV